MENNPVILLMDPNADFAESIRTAFLPLGYHVVVARDANEGFQLHRQLRPDIVVTEMCLPDRSGFRVLEALKSSDPSFPVIMVTGFGSWEQRKLAEFLGGNGFLQKPVSMNRLIETVQRQCRPVSHEPQLAEMRALDVHGGS